MVPNLGGVVENSHIFAIGVLDNGLQRQILVLSGWGREIGEGERERREGGAELTKILSPGISLYLAYYLFVTKPQGATPILPSIPLLTYHQLVCVGNIGRMMFVVVQIQGLGGNHRSQSLGNLKVKGGESENSSPL